MTPRRHDPRLLTHTAHDVARLLARWQQVARAAGLDWRVLHETEGWPVVALRHPGAREDVLYLSTGVHGDEPGAVLGLLEWAEENTALLAEERVLIFPVFNPAGLAANTRADAAGLDLNRAFHDTAHPHIAAWLREVEGVHFRAALCLHEDYDAQGLYCYEINAGEFIAESLMEACAPVIPRDARLEIEGRAACGGIIQMHEPPEGIPGEPEALALFRRGTPVTLTFETPSEFALTDRADAHAQFVRSFLRRS
jgi:murein peptide amidase A